MENKSSSFWRYLVIYLSLVFLSLIMFFTNSRTSFLNKFTQAPLAIWQGVTSSTTGKVKETLDAIGELAQMKIQLREAQERIRELEEIESTALISQSELIRLKELLSFQEENHYDTLPAQIIAKDPYSHTGIFTINKGEKDGIAIDFPVIAYQKGHHALVGKVHQVSYNSAKVIPLSNSSNFVSARFLNSRYEGLVSGEGTYRDELKMEYTSKEALSYIKIGEKVITSGLGEGYPPNILIGELKSIINDENLPFLKMEVTPAVTTHKLEYVFIIKPQNQFSLD